MIEKADLDAFVRQGAGDFKGLRGAFIISRSQIEDVEDPEARLAELEAALKSRAEELEVPVLFTSITDTRNGAWIISWERKFETRRRSMG